MSDDKKWHLFELLPEFITSFFNAYFENRISTMNAIYDNYNNFLKAVRRYKKTDSKSSDYEQVLDDFESAYTRIKSYFAIFISSTRSEDILELLSEIKSKLSNYHSYNILYQVNENNLSKCKRCISEQELKILSGPQCTFNEYDEHYTHEQCEQFLKTYESKIKFAKDYFKELENKFNKLEDLIHDFCHPEEVKINDFKRITKKIENSIDKEKSLNEYPQE